MMKGLTQPFKSTDFILDTWGSRGLECEAEAGWEEGGAGR